MKTVRWQRLDTALHHQMQNDVQPTRREQAAAPWQASVQVTAAFAQSYVPGQVFNDNIRLAKKVKRKVKKEARRAAQKGCGSFRASALRPSLLLILLCSLCECALCIAAGCHRPPAPRRLLNRAHKQAGPAQCHLLPPSSKRSPTGGSETLKSTRAGSGRSC
jgi:hypothetical protein